LILSYKALSFLGAESGRDAIDKQQNAALYDRNFSIINGGITSVAEKKEICYTGK